MKPEYLYRINTGYWDPADADTVRDCLEGWGPRWAGTWNKATIILRLIQHCHEEALAEGSEGLAHLDPVLAAVLERDIFCQGCGSLQHLERHSHLQPHSKAAPGDCVLLCHECHYEYHHNLVTIEWRGPGDIVFRRK